MALKSKCVRCSGREALLQAPHYGRAWAICQRCLATLAELSLEAAAPERDAA
jgi:hypothetical protein